DDDGFGVLSAVTERRDFDVIFLTAHAQYAVDAFDREVLDYLLKPVDPDRFERALERAKASIAARHEERLEPAPAPLRRIVVEKDGLETFLSVTRIDWAGADGNYVRLYSGGDIYTVRATLDGFARRLDPNRFVQVNRGELVNLDCVREMRPLPHGE